MPVTQKRYTEAEQSERVRRHRALADTRLLWAANTPAGDFEVRCELGEYTLSGGGLALFGITDPFSPDLTLTAAGDDDAVSEAKRLIAARWRQELGEIEAGFGLAECAAVPPPGEQELHEQIGL